MGPSCATRQALPPPSTGRKPVATALASMVSGRQASGSSPEPVTQSTTAAGAASTAAAAAPAFMARVASDVALRSVALASPWLTALPQDAPVSSTPNGSRMSITAACTRASRCCSDSPLGSAVPYGSAAKAAVSSVSASNSCHGRPS